MLKGREDHFTNTVLLILLQKALKERGIDTMLAEAREESKDDDAQHLRRTGS